jgi:flagellar biogenesis protein FliO
MNSLYQTILALSIVLLAVCYLAWLIKRSRKSSCGSNCSCAHAKLPTKQLPQEKR